MGKVRFLDDNECQSAIIRLTSEAVTRWAPGKAKQVDIAADEYFHQVQDAGHILYPAQVGHRPLGFGESEIWTLIILPVATGFLGNLLSDLCVETFKELKSRAAQRRRSNEPQGDSPSTLIEPDGIRPLIEQEARATGLSPKQVEQLAGIFSAVLSELVVAEDEPSMRDVDENS